MITMSRLCSFSCCRHRACVGGTEARRSPGVVVDLADRNNQPRMCAGHDACMTRQAALLGGNRGRGRLHRPRRLLAGAVTAFVALAPPILIEAVAGLALVWRAFQLGHGNAGAKAESREAAARSPSLSYGIGCFLCWDLWRVLGTADLAGGLMMALSLGCSCSNGEQRGCFFMARL